MDTQTALATRQRIDLVARIKTLFLQQLAIHIESPDQDLLETGALDSAAFVQMLLELAQEFSIEIPVSDLNLDSLRSVNAIADMVAARQKEQGDPTARWSFGVSDCRLGQCAATPPAPEGDSALAEEIRDLLWSALMVKVDSDSADLFTSGSIDSMGLVQLIVQFEQRFGISLPIRTLELDSFRSVQNMVNLVTTQRRYRTALAAG